MIRHVERGLAVGAAAALTLLMVVVLIDVIGRDVFNRPLASGTELTELLMGTMAFLSFPLLTYRQRDITVDLVDMLAGARWEKAQVALAGTVGAIVFGLLAFQLVTSANRAATSGEATDQLHVALSWAWWFMCVMAAATAMAGLTVAISVFTRHPVESIKPSEVD